MPTVYLVSGANRGIGLGMVHALAKKPDTIIFAGARDASNQTLVELSKQYPGVVLPISLVSADLVNNQEAAKVIAEKAGKIDTVIANAGIGRMGVPLADASMADMTEHFTVNVLGPLALFQATVALLRNSSSSAGSESTSVGRFIVVSSLVGSTGELVPFHAGPYGTSKAAVNHLTVKLQQENPDLVILPVCPGPVQTDMGQTAADSFGLKVEEFAMPVEVSVAKVLDHITKIERVDGQQTLWSASGTEVRW